MQALLTHVAGVDVHKDKLAITALIGAANEEPKAEQFESLTFTEDLQECGKRLLGMGIKHVAMESTGIYWKPIYNVWEPMGFIITVGNAKHIKNVPGRKTDMKDSQWIAQLHRFGLIRSSFVPSKEFQLLRLMNRHRTNLTSDLTKVKNRVQKVLEDGNVKLGSVVSDVFGVAGIAVLDLIANGNTDRFKLARAVTTRIKKKGDVAKALTNCLTEEHCFVIQQLMLQYIDIKQRISEIDKKLDKNMEKHSELIDKLDEIPGIDKVLARGIVAEATNDLSTFSDDRKFAAWSGTASGNNESAGKKNTQNADMEIQL